MKTPTNTNSLRNKAAGLLHSRTARTARTVVIGLLLLLGLAANSSALPTFTRGTLICQATGLPEANALVTLTYVCNQGTRVTKTTTDLTGSFAVVTDSKITENDTNRVFQISSSACKHTWTVPFNFFLGTLVCTDCRSSEYLQLDFVRVGHPGNPADTNDGDANTPGVQNYGSVADEFCISTTEVTAGDYAIFLNDVDPLGNNPSDIYNLEMDLPDISGIQFTGTPNTPGPHYAVRPGFAGKPAAYVSFFSAMRFANWLHNGGRDSTVLSLPMRMNDGAYTLGTPSLGLEVRNGGAKYWIPNMNEWYKAAYYAPNRGSSSFYYNASRGAGSYWLFPMQVDFLAYGPPGGQTILNRAHTNSDQFLDVKSFPVARSYFGTFDQGGNALEWIEELRGTNRAVRGAGIGDGFPPYLSSQMTATGPVGAADPAAIEYSGSGDPFGFRVAGVCPANPVTVCVNPPPNMVLWLPFDEPAGPVARNSTGGNNGTHIAGPTVVGGMVLNALSFDGVNDYVEIPSYPAIDFGDSTASPGFSVDAWIMREANVGVVQSLIDKRDQAGAEAGYHMYLFQNGLGFRLAGNGTTGNYNLTGSIPLGVWTHVAVTIRRNDPQGGRFYINGVEHVGGGFPFTTVPYNGSMANTKPFRVGSRSSTISGLFRGRVDELEVFSRVLRADEIASLYAAGPIGKCKSACSLPSSTVFPSGAPYVTVSAQICNNSGTAQTFGYAFQGAPPVAGCSIPGPTTFFPSAGTVTLQPGECVQIPVVIWRPAGLDNTWGLPFSQLSHVACYELVLTSPDGQIEYERCRGSLLKEIGPLKLDGALSGGLLGVKCTGIGCKLVDVDIPVINSTLSPTSVNYEISILRDDQSIDAEAVQLNGLPPGVPLFGTLGLAAGQSATLNFDAAFLLNDPLHTYTILMQTDPTGNGVMRPFASISLQNAVPASVAIQSVVSRKAHGAAGDFDIPLPLTGVPGIECRRGNIPGDHTLIVTFNNEMQTTGASVAVGGIGSIAGPLTFNGNQMTVHLTGVADSQVVTLTLNGAKDIAGQVLAPASVSMAVLLADVNGSRVVNSTDIVQVKSESGQAVDASNFRKDVNASGVINSTDIVIVKSRSGSALP